MSKLESSLTKLSELLFHATNKMSQGRKRFAKSLLEEILNIIKYQEVENDVLRGRLSKVTRSEYVNSLEKTIAIIQCLGFDFVEISTMKKEYIDFFLLHKDLIAKKEPITIERFKQYMNIIRYFEQTNARMPETIKELNTALNEIKELREQD